MVPKRLLSIISSPLCLIPFLLLIMMVNLSLCSSSSSPAGTIRANDFQQQDASLSMPDSVLFLLISFTLTLSLLLSYFTHSIHFIPKTLLSTSLGIILSLSLQLINPNVTKQFQIDSSFFFMYLLPSIIFYSGYQMDRLKFYENIGSIIVLAVLNTLGSALVLAFILLLALPWREALLFGSILAAIDPVATVSLLLEMDFDETVTTVLFGESVLNDAVVLVLYKAIADFTRHPSVSFQHLLLTVLNFGWIVVGSIVVGVLLSLLTALAFKFIQFRKYPPIEVSLFLIMCYMPYVVAESIGLSGIFAILTGAILNGHYANKNLSEKTSIAVDYLFETMSHMAESLVFIYLGLGIFAFDHHFNVWLVIVTFVACVVSRGVSVIPLVKTLNPMRTTKISNSSVAVMWFSNLRGAICFCLTLDFPSENYRDQIRTTSLVIVLLTISIFGGGLYPFLKLLENFKSERERRRTRHHQSSSRSQLDSGDIPNSPAVELSDHESFDQDAADDEDDDRYAITIALARQKKVTASFFSRMDEKYLKPWLCLGQEHQVLSLSTPTQSRPGMPEYFGVSSVDEDEEDLSLSGAASASNAASETSQERNV